MGQFDMWQDFGFTNNPYSQETLLATAEGSALFAGRPSQLADIQRRIGSTGAHPSIEGPIGAGKTSLLNVAIYRMFEHGVTTGEGELWVPSVTTLQPRKDSDEFELEAYRAILQTLLAHEHDFWRAGLNKPDLTRLSTWLTSPEYSSWQAGAGTVQAGGGKEPNTTEGFQKSGFPAAIREVLAQIYAGKQGGIVLILDNLEVVGQVGEARSRLDELRDRVFSIPNVRWVLCGSRGIVSRARTQRLSGTFATALQIKPLTEDEVVSAIALRIKTYGHATALPPLTPEGFRFLYGALHQNLRDAMTWAQQFSHWLNGEYLIGKYPGPDDRDQLVQDWLLAQAETAQADARNIQNRQWLFFDVLCERGGRAGSSEHLDYGFQKQEQFVGAVSAFVNANLITREPDPDDANKTVNVVTANGWLVSFYRTEQRKKPSLVTEASIKPVDNL